MNKFQLLTCLKGLAVVAGLSVLVLNTLGRLSTSTCLALLSLELAAYWGMTIGSMVRR
jgi:hypothetical protein